MGEEVSSRSVASRGSGLADYQINIRALSSGDIPQTPLPYDANTRLNDTKTAIAVDAWAESQWTVADWGADKDFYPYWFNLQITDEEGNTLAKSHQGFHLIVRAEQDSSERPFIKQSLHQRNFRMQREQVDPYKWRWLKSYDLKGVLIPSDWELHILVQNCCEVIVSEIDFEIVGVAI